MPKRIIKKIKSLGEKKQTNKKVKDRTVKRKKSPSKRAIQKKIGNIRKQRQQISQEKVLRKKEKQLKKQLKRFANKRNSLKGDYKTKFPIFGRGRDEDAQEVERYESRLSMEHQLENELEKIERAIDRIKNGSYGTCVVCKKKIHPERLKIYPEAEHCMKCHKKGLGS